MLKLVVILTLAGGAAARGGEQLEIDLFRKNFTQLESQLWAQLEESNEIGKESAQPEVGLIRAYELFGDALQKEYPEDITHGLKGLDGSWVWARAYAELRTLYAFYETFRRFQVQQTAPGRVPSPKQAWLDLAETVLNDSKASVPATTQQLHELVMQEKLFRNVLREVDSGLNCNLQQSPQQTLINLYKTIVLTELKGYSMVQFSYMLLRLYDKGNFTKESEIMKERFDERSRETLQSIKEAMKLASRELWRCDPKKHIKGETYFEITELLQGYMQNEVDLNPEGTCRENCAEYTYTKSHSCYQNLYCRQQRRCNGKIINCQFIDSDSWVCPAAFGSNRRYEYIEYENGRILGRKMGCSKGTTKVDSWWRWMFWHCSYCMCLCDEQGTNSDRYINLRSALADTANNRVVTGIKFLKKNRVMHMQVQEGLLLPRGKIDASTVRWVPVDDYKITDHNVFNGQDFHTLTWESRAMDLDDLKAPEGQVLTGVRWKMIGSHVNLEINAMAFDYETGKLDVTKSQWRDNTNTDASTSNPRKKLDLEHCDIPTRANTPSMPDSVTDMYFDFTHTDLDRDAAQTTVPFIDAQAVESAIPVPLSGVGIYHKGSKHFGGYIAPKLITYDYSNLLQNAINDLDLKHGEAVN